VTLRLKCCPDGVHSVQDAGELFQAMELEMEARAPSNAAFLAPPPGRVAAFGAWALSFIIPGLGMFTEAYFVFSVRGSLPHGLMPQRGLLNS